MKGDYFKKVREASAYIRDRVRSSPKVMLVLSGGLNKFVDKVEDPVTILACDVPNFPEATAEGHSGKMIFGKVGDISLVVFQGRFHFYEGHRMQNIVFPVFTMNDLGAKTLVVTNAVGCINPDFEPGDIMLIRDHINFMGTNPLIGISTQVPENQFPDMTDAYSERLQKVARKAAKEAGVRLREGIYIATSGPSYETKAEIAMFRKWGADAVGMSVIPEITAAKFLNMETLGFSCIANAAADLHTGGMSHHEVLTAMKGLEERLVDLLLAVVPKLK